MSADLEWVGAERADVSLSVPGEEGPDGDVCDDNTLSFTVWGNGCVITGTKADLTRVLEEALEMVKTLPDLRL